MNWNSKVSLLWISLFAVQNLVCQELTAKKDLSYPSLRIGYTPSALLNRYPGIQFSLDKGISNNGNFSLEIGGLFGESYLEDNNFGNTWGIRVRPSIETLVTSNDRIGLYLGFGINARYTNTKIQEEILRNGGQFSEIIEYNKTKSFIGGAFTGGLFIKTGNRFYIDIGGGIGYGRYIVKDKNLPPNTRPNDIFFDFEWDEAGNYTLPIIIMHFNVSYDISYDSGEKNVSKRKR